MRGAKAFPLVTFSGCVRNIVLVRSCQRRPLMGTNIIVHHNIQASTRRVRNAVVSTSPVEAQNVLRLERNSKPLDAPIAQVSCPQNVADLEI